MKKVTFLNIHKLIKDKQPQTRHKTCYREKKKKIEIGLTWQHFWVTRRRPVIFCGDNSSISNPIKWRGRSKAAVFDFDDDGG